MQLFGRINPGQKCIERCDRAFIRQFQGGVQVHPLRFQVGQPVHQLRESSDRSAQGGCELAGTVSKIQKDISRGYCGAGCVKARIGKGSEQRGRITHREAERIGDRSHSGHRLL